MDTNPSPSLAARSSARPTHKNISRLKKIAIGAIVVSALLTIIEFGIPFIRHGSSNIPPFAVAIGPTPASVLYTVDNQKSAFAPLTVLYQEKNLPALDAQKGAHGEWYFILAEPSKTPVGNLYKRTPDGAVTRLTTSSTAKYNLSYDARSGRLAYQAITFKDERDFATNQSWDLVVFDLAKNAEMVVGKGTNPHLAAGGQALFFKDGNELVTALIGSRATSSIMSLGAQPLYAISADGIELSTYNATTHAVDHFTFTHGTSPSYVSSETLPILPVSMGYVEGTLVVASVGKTASSTIFMFSRPGTNESTVSIPSTITGAPLRIYTYE